MKRTLNYQIKQTEEKMTVGEYLRKSGYSHRLLAQLKRTPQAILVNKEWVPAGHLLYTDDIITVRIEESASSEHIVPSPMELAVIYEDEDILVINKPADMPIHPSINHYEHTLANGVLWHYFQQGEPFVFRCINRLDRDTSGILIIAKHNLSAAILSDAMKKREISRTYLAIANGHLSGQGTIDAPIARKADSAIERCVNFQSGETAVTHYSALAYDPEHDLSLLSLKLDTGRTHQIRIHLQYIGHPLIGDFLYPSRHDLMQRQALHSWKLSFCHPITKEHLEFQAPLPLDFHAAYSSYFSNVLPVTWDIPSNNNL